MTETSVPTPEQPAKDDAAPELPRYSREPMQDHSTYLYGRQEWNERYGDYITRARNWKFFAILCILICLIQTAGLFFMFNQNKIVPFVVQTDRLVLPAPNYQTQTNLDQRVLKAMLARFIEDVRSVVVDGSAQRQMIDRVHAMLSRQTRAFSIIKEYYRANPPFERAQNFSISVAISSVIPLTDRTWQVEWTETKRDHLGALISRKSWKATLTYDINPPQDELLIRKNPLGIYVVDLNWSESL